MLLLSPALQAFHTTEGLNRLEQVEEVSQLLQAALGASTTESTEPGEPNWTHPLFRLEARYTDRCICPAQLPFFMCPQVKTHPRCQRDLKLCCRDNSMEGIAPGFALPTDRLYCDGGR